MMQKIKPFRSQQYLRFVRSLPCSMCGAPADDAHHVAGLHWNLGGTGTKPGDEYTMPLCRPCHGAVHWCWGIKDSQPEWLAKTIRAGLWRFGNDCDIGRALIEAREFIRQQEVAA